MRVEGGAVPRAVDLQPGGRQKGSVTKAAGLLEKLSSSRLGQILSCIEGQCAFDKHDGTETQCRAGCGRTLHVATCAQLGRGYAAIGNFTCPDCRILASGLDPANEDDLSPMRRTVVHTMVLELGQGRSQRPRGTRSMCGWRSGTC